MGACAISSPLQTDYMPFDPTVKRTEGTISLPSGAYGIHIENKGLQLNAHLCMHNTHIGETFKTTKGAPHILLKLIDDEGVVEKVEEDVKALGLRGVRALAVAKTDAKGDWHMLGLLTFLDPPRPDTRHTIETAMKYG